MQLRRRKRRSTEEFMESFDKDLPTYVIVHGWKSSTASDTVQVIFLHSKEDRGNCLFCFHHQMC